MARSSTLPACRRLLGRFAVSISAAVALVVALPRPARAAIDVHPLFSDNAVLRRGNSVPVWGTTDSKEPVTVELAGQKASGKPSGGTWRVNLPDLKYGGPHTLVVTQGASRLEKKNILVGDVWLCGGQSNMQWPLVRSERAKQVIAGAKHDAIRLFTVARYRGEKQAGPIGKWEVCTPESAAGFSAVGYHFGRALHEARGLPIGLISSNLGGTNIERWISAEALASDPRLSAAPRSGPTSDLYDNMVKPLVPFLIRGVIWYQGESNIDDAFAYRDLLPALINDWRRAWNQPDMPFLIVQIAPVGKPSPNVEASVWAELREAQLVTTQRVFNTELAVITDLGDETGHSPFKTKVGERLALAARAMCHGEQIEFSGPVYESMQIDGNRVVLQFQHADGLRSAAGPLAGFNVCGPDRVFHPAEATIEPHPGEGDAVVLSSDRVPQPIAVRYGWATAPQATLVNAAGLPASPFRTDAFRLITQDRPILPAKTATP